MDYIKPINHLPHTTDVQLVQHYISADTLINSKLLRLHFYAQSIYTAEFRLSNLPRGTVVAPCAVNQTYNLWVTAPSSLSIVLYYRLPVGVTNCSLKEIFSDVTGRSCVIYSTPCRQATDKCALLQSLKLGVLSIEACLPPCSPQPVPTVWGLLVFQLVVQHWASQV